MVVLGLNGGSKCPEEVDTFFDYQHDAAAVLMCDGKIECAIEEERLNRIKHTNCFPRLAIEHCLKNTGTTWKDLDSVVYVSDPRRLRVSTQWNALEDTISPIPPTAEAFISFLFEREFAVDVRKKLTFCDHHIAHVWSAFPCSGFDEALVVSLDGEGDGRAGLICAWTGNKMFELRDYPTSLSLGNLYTSMIRLLGYTRFDEYKVMGLAPYGERSALEAAFAPGYHLLAKGHYVIDPIFQWTNRFHEQGIVDQARRRGGAFAQIHLNFAAALQDMLEKIVLHVLSHFRRETGLRNLCLAGGVAHNCTLNGKILQSGLFDRVFVQPASHDAGGALGAAYWVTSIKTGTSKYNRIRDVYLGTSIGTSDSIKTVLDQWGSFLDFEQCDDMVPKAASIVASGEVIGWMQGRSEFGPRALGNRSILADARPTANKDLVNSIVKKREQFRPFAPSVPEERLRDFFDLPSCEADLSYMSYALPVRECMRHVLGAVTHIDGTARLQTVSRSTNPRFWSLLTAFGDLTDIPILLNTSFNNNTEPIVDSVTDAVVSFLTTDLKVLVIGDYIIRKTAPASSDGAWLNLIPRIPTSCRLLRSSTRSGFIHQIEITKRERYRILTTDISALCFHVLGRCDEMTPLADLLDYCCVTQPTTVHNLIEEITRLWRQRLIQLRPQLT
ncbi:MAG TPA: carbamoyltransferase C-terminal domain-containing protein [Terriglobales bacterium]|nr:carbamoyltransferase C-terminal domain-containing protein [Terriglobales bacterium]